MTVAFLILNHRGPDQLLRLMRVLRSQLPQSPLVVHHDRFQVELDGSVLDAFANAHVLTALEPVRWGHFSIVEATWRSLQWMLDNVDFDWAVVLSGQDYPIRPLTGLGQYLASTGADALVRADPIDQLETAAERRIRRRRYFYQYRPARNLSKPNGTAEAVWARLRNIGVFPADVFNNVQPFFSIYRFPHGMPWRLGRRANHTPFSPDFPCWFGSAWFGLSRRAVAYLLSFAEQNPFYCEYYRRTIIPDESATATILCNSSELKVLNAQLHYARWSDSKSSHPDVFKSDDLNELLLSSAYFARKFDVSGDPDVLDELDALLAQYLGSS